MGNYSIEIGSVANILLTRNVIDIIDFHYKHTVINTWGGRCIKTWTRDFLMAEGDMVAQSDLDLDSGFDSEFPPSSAVFYQSLVDV